jgi:hypothetical protein
MQSINAKANRKVIKPFHDLLTWFCFLKEKNNLLLLKLTEFDKNISINNYLNFLTQFWNFNKITSKVLKTFEVFDIAYLLLLNYLLNQNFLFIKNLNQIHTIS